MLTVTTNNHRREVIDSSRLTLAERREFDYLDWDALERGDDSASFFRYKGELYDLGSVTRFTGGPLTDLGWQGGGYAFGMFGGLVVKFVDNGYDTDIVVGFYSE